MRYLPFSLEKPIRFQWQGAVVKTQLKNIVYGTPILGPSVKKAWRSWMTWRLPFSTSGDYWERRYRIGENSGAGSYGRLASFKAEVLNDFVACHAIKSIVEFGSGDGNQLSLSDYGDATYLGLDISKTAIEMCQKRFAGDLLKSFCQYDSSEIQNYASEFRQELSMSLDVIYHLVEDSTFDDYMRNLFNSATRFVVIYSSDKHDESKHAHVRHRKFTDWVAANQPEWTVCQKIPNRFPLEEGRENETCFSDFYIFAKQNSPEALMATSASGPKTI